MSVNKEDLLIGGIRVHVFKRSGTPTEGPVAVLFVLHGRHGSAGDVDWVANQILTSIKPVGSGTHKDLWIVTFDHRNHGSRLVDARSNNTWTETDKNPLHALDMYSIQFGTSRDVSFLIDFLPLYLFPNGPSRINSWGIAGISLGGHSTWICLAHEPRLELGIPIIGCPDYEALMKYRANKSKISYDAPHIPASLTSLMGRIDPASQAYTAKDSSNPFLGKKILVLSGKEDTLVPWVASDKFVDKLECKLKQVVVAEGVGHECTPSMIDQVVQFVSSGMLM